MKAEGVKNTGVERAKASQYARHPGRMSNNNTEEPKEVLETEGTRIECSIEELGEIELVRVHNWRDGNYANWKTMIEQYHYLGHGKLYGKQIRYLIRSESFGCIGALAFSSAAWRLRAREEWIGWNEENRLKYLNRIVCNIDEYEANEEGLGGARRDRASTRGNICREGAVFRYVLSGGKFSACRNDAGARQTGRWE